METEQWVDRERAVWKQFPLHPQPEPLESFTGPLESFTSYIIRLAEANGLQSLNELATLAGMSWSRLSASPDYPYPRNEGLAQIAGCTEAKLESATFLHLAQRFGCPLHLQPLRRFLQSSLAPTLRYCPRCLAEQPSAYYSLTWRFLAVQGCARHNCVLLDHCGHCGDLLPNVPRCPRLGWCLPCHGNLRTCQAPSLTVEAAQSVRVQTSTLELLLSPEQRNQDGKPAVAIGKCFATLRQDRHHSMAEVAYLSGRDEQILLEIEFGNLHRKASFDDYVCYAESLASSLKTIVEMLPFQEGLPTDEEGLLKLVDETAQHLQAQGKPTTPAQIARHMGLSVQHLRKSPRIHSLLVIWEQQHKRAVAQFQEQREQELTQQVENTIKYLILHREPITQQRVAQLLGMSYQGLRIYPRVEALLMKVNINFHLTKQRSHLDGSLERRKAILSI